MRFFSRVFLPFLLFGYIATETYLKMQHRSLCSESGCKLAGELLNFDAIYLHYFALAGLLLLLIFGYLSFKNKFYESLFFIGLYAAIAFEATILSYQFIANSEACIFCYAVLASLLLISLFSQSRHFVPTLTIVFAIFAGINTLSIPENRAFVSGPGYYLIHSERCSHCLKVKAYFSKNHIKYTEIPVEEASTKSFMKFLDRRKYPLLIINEKSKTTLINGDKTIISYFETKKNTNITKQQKDNK